MNPQLMCRVSPSVMDKHPAILRPSPKYNLTNMKSSVPGDHNRNHLVSPHSDTTECPAISRTSPKYNSTNLKSSVYWKT